MTVSQFRAEGWAICHKKELLLSPNLESQYGVLGWKRHWQLTISAPMWCLWVTEAQRQEQVQGHRGTKAEQA